MEFRSFSKTGGFTGVRCGFTVMSKRLLAQTRDGRALPLHPLWHRRWSTKANSVSYPVQRGAEALYSAEGQAQVRGLIEHYMGNARILSEAASAAGMQVYGGKNAPYIWVQTPDGLTSWQMFDRMLEELNVVVTPGSGFGSEGEGYFRISRLQQPGERRRSGAAFAGDGPRALRRTRPAIAPPCRPASRGDWASEKQKGGRAGNLRRTVAGKRISAGEAVVFPRPVGPARRPPERFRRLGLVQHGPPERFRRLGFAQHGSQERFRCLGLVQHGSPERFRRLGLAQHRSPERFRRVGSSALRLRFHSRNGCWMGA